MGKKLNKSDLTAEIQFERQKLEAFLTRLPISILRKRTIPPSNWSVKDVIAHVLDWEQRTLDWYEDGRIGSVVFVPAEGFRWNDLQQLNLLIYKRYRNQSVSNVLERFHAVHERTMKTIASLTDRELTSLNHFAWTGASWTLSDYIRANTASHYRWALKKIRPWYMSLDLIASASQK